MKLICHGAAREVTGSCHELQIVVGGPSRSGRAKSGVRRILLDCGLFQGSRKKSVEKNATFAFDPARDIDAVVLSHAHMDHAGRIPLLYKRGYRGPVFCTYATKDLAEVMLQDSGYIHEKDEAYFLRHCPRTRVPCDGPLYTQEDARACMEIFKGKNYGEWFEVVAPSPLRETSGQAGSLLRFATEGQAGQAGVRAKFLDAGHVLGAAMVILEVAADVPRDKEESRMKNQESGEKKRSIPNSRFLIPDSPVRRIGFSGDLGRDMLPIIRDPAPMPPVDVLICESTYGNREHEDIETAKDTLRDVIVRTAERGGKVLIPAFSLERTQEIIYDLHTLWDEKRIPEIPIVVDSPLASRVTEIFMKHPECYDAEMYERFLARAHNPFQFSLVRYTGSVEESKALNTTPGPMIIMAGSGMCEGGRIRHHLRQHIEDPRCTVLAVGFMAEHTLGRRLVESNVQAVRIFDETYWKKAEIVSINAYSGHADRRGLDAFIAGAGEVRKLFLVHGEEAQILALAERTLRLRSGQARRALSVIEVVMPESGVAYAL